MTIIINCLKLLLVDYIIIFILGIGFLFIMVFVGISFQPAIELKNCTYQPIRTLEENINQIEAEVLIDGELCYQNKILIERFRDCYRKPEREALTQIGLIEFLVDKLDSGRPSIKELIRFHNLYCPSNRVPAWEEKKLL